MRADAETYHQVAERCSKFDSRGNRDRYSNSASNEDNTTCHNCVHFDQSEYCKLDLYDSIVKSHNLV